MEPAGTFPKGTTDTALLGIGTLVGALLSYLAFDTAYLAPLREARGNENATIWIEMWGPLLIYPALVCLLLTFFLGLFFVLSLRKLLRRPKG